MKTMVYTVTGTPTENGHVLIDGGTIQFIVDLNVNTRGNMPPQNNKTASDEVMSKFADHRSIEAKNFENEILFLLNECTVKTSRAYDNSDSFLCKTANVSLYFSKTKIDYYSSQIGFLLSQLASIETVEGLSTLASGEKWNRSMQSVSFLIALGSAAQFLHYDENLEQSYKQAAILQRSKRKMR